MSIERIPKWESEMWSQISAGDGLRCPLYEGCRIRQKGGWCHDENKELLSQLISAKRFDYENCRPIGKGAPCSVIFQGLEKLSQRYIKKGKVSHPPVPEELISLMDEQCPIVEVRLLPLKNCHGAIWHLDGEWVIQLKESDSPAMRRFVLFHEAFHILAHINSIPGLKKIGIKGSPFNEMLADSFAISIHDATGSFLNLAST